MSHILVNIISAQTVPNYLFIRDLYQKGDSLLFYYSSKLSIQIQWILNTLTECGFSDVDYDYEAIELNEEDWEAMTSKINSSIQKDKQYLVNLTGGTKYMSLAIQQQFVNLPNVKFYYIPFPKNILLLPPHSQFLPINHRVTVDEYMTVHNVEYTAKTITQDRDYTYHFFTMFTKKEFSPEELSIISQLRSYRRKGFRDIRNGYISNQGKFHEKTHKINGLSTFLTNIAFPLSQQNSLTATEVQYITGGWFEEYMYFFVKDKINPDDIVIGLTVKQSQETNKNDLDVVFTKGNKLFVIECKTSITPPPDIKKSEEAMFREISYKAATIKATLLRLPGISMICSLSEGNDNFKQVAKNMGIDFYDKRYFMDKESSFVDEILNKAK